MQANFSSSPSTMAGFISFFWIVSAVFAVALGCGVGMGVFAGTFLSCCIDPCRAIAFF